MLGTKDTQTVDKQGQRFLKLSIQGLKTISLHNILTRSGLMTEVFRIDWFAEFKVNQINWVELKANGVTDWHCHARQTDRLIAVGETIKFCFFDARPNSPTHGATEIIRSSIALPMIVEVPPGVWHGLRNEANIPSGYLNVIDELYVHEEPDDLRLPFDSSNIPIEL